MGTIVKIAEKNFPASLALAIEINGKQVTLFYTRPNPISEVEVVRSGN